MNEKIEIIADALAQKNVDFIKNLTSDFFDDVSFQDFQQLSHDLIKMDWALGLSLFREASLESRHGWFWSDINSVHNPGNITFRAIHAAKPSCFRELIKGVYPEVLGYALIIGSHNSSRPLKITQNRLKCFGYLAKEFSELPEEIRVKFLDSSYSSVRAILENNNLDVTKIFLGVADIKKFWAALWDGSKYFLQKDKHLIIKNDRAVKWAECVENLWQATSSMDDIPVDIKNEIFVLISQPENQSFLPRIHSEISKKEIYQVLNLGASSVYEPRKSRKRL